jgi:hypothetical protein
MFRHFITPFYTVISLPQVVCRRETQPH